ncbi:hypothetical protein Tco_0968732 [Tanacetum coccineum]
MGDFNEVRFRSDRLGSNFNAHGANLFNSFISNSGLVEVTLGGSRKNVKVQFKKDLEAVNQIIDSGQGVEEDIRIRSEIILKIRKCDEIQSFCNPGNRVAKICRSFHNRLNSDQMHGTGGEVSLDEGEEAYGNVLHDTVNISHLFYADDAVFVGQWSDRNISTLTYVLECFYLASGLKINMSKSKIMGIHVNNDNVNRAAENLGCLVLKAPFMYLGSTVGGDMHRLSRWKDTIDRVRRRLSKWKMKMLSIGGRLTLVKSVLGSMPIFHMSLFKVPSGILKVLESIRSHFFNGHDISSKKVSWVNWNKIFDSRNFALGQGYKAIHGGMENLGSICKRVFENQKWGEWEILFRFGRILGMRWHSYNSTRYPGDSLGNVQSISIGDSFRRYPRGGAEFSQFGEFSALMHQVIRVPWRIG